MDRVGVDLPGIRTATGPDHGVDHGEVLDGHHHPDGGAVTVVGVVELSVCMADISVQRVPEGKNKPAKIQLCSTQNFNCNIN